MMISVVIPLYNKSQWIVGTIQTVLNQRFQDFEIVVVDDGSTDDGPSKVKSIGDCRIRLVCQSNAGVSAARNRGIEEARGEFIAFLDADDEWHPNYLATQKALIENYPACDVFATNYEFRNVQGQITPTILHKLPFDGDTGILSNYFEVASCSHPPLWTSAVVVRRSAIQAVGGFPVGIKSGEDLLTWARLAVKYQIAYCTTPLAVFVDSASNTGSSKSEMRAGGEAFVLRELMALYELSDILLRSQIQQYVLWWYKVYCVLLIENKDNHKAIPLSLRAIRFGGDIRKFLPIIVLGTLPPAFAKRLFLKLRR